MTTALLTPMLHLPRPAAADQRTRLRMTVRGRRVLAFAVALPLVVLVFFGVLSGGAALATRDTGVGAASFVTVSVQPGDTLWSIAGEVAPASDPRDVIDAIKRLNLLESSAVIAGQQLAIPAEYAP